MFWSGKPSVKIEEIEARAAAAERRATEAARDASAAIAERDGLAAELAAAQSRIKALQDGAASLETDLTKIGDAALAVAKGDFETRILGFADHPQLGTLALAINDMIDQADAYVRESSATLQYASQGKFYRPFLVRGMLGSFRTGAEIINDAREGMYWLEVGAAEQRSRLAQHFKESISGFVAALVKATIDMRETAERMAHGASETTSRAQAVAAASEEASSNTQTVAAASEELTASIAEISRQVTEASRVSNSASAAAGSANDTIMSLARAAEEIGAIVSLIRDVAGQTNLLALNATIEAARAGEAGKGFAVVASEVKGLANQTAKATEEISDKIGLIQGKTRESVDAIRDITNIVARVSEVSGSIAAAVEEQSASTSEISRNVQEAAAGTRDVSANIASVSQGAIETGEASHQVSSAAGEMATEVEKLRAEVELFLAQITNRRRHERYAVNLTGTATVAGVSTPISFADMSEGGASLKGDIVAQPGDVVEITVPALNLKVTAEMVSIRADLAHVALRPRDRAERDQVIRVVRPYLKSNGQLLAA